MSAQGDWLEHARRHLDRAEWHRGRGEDDLVYARTEIAGAISDLWTAAQELEAELDEPRTIYLSPRFGSSMAPCGEFIVRCGEWSRLTRTTTDASRVTCEDCRTEEDDG